MTAATTQAREAALHAMENELTQVHRLRGSLRAISALTRCGRERHFDALEREDLASLIDTLAEDLSARLQALDDHVDVARGLGRAKRRTGLHLVPKRG